MSRIKIFVTQRIDKKSVMVENEILQPIRCGAVFDKSNSTILGDNTGENISEKRNSYCELTTQYWAWKNTDYDYYGFFHYRRYFSFAKETYKEDFWANIPYRYFGQKAIKDLCLDEKSIHEAVEGYDILVGKPFDVAKLNIKNIREHYAKAEALHEEDMDVLLEILHNDYPEYREAVDKYFNGTLFYPCNMFIMKKEYFDKYCNWLYEVLEKFDKKIDISKYSEERYRTAGHMGERLLGVYYTYLKLKNPNLKSKEMQIAVFHNTDPQETLKPAFEKNSVPIILASSNYYAPMMSVTLQSLINTASKEKNYDIVILTQDMNQENKSYLKNLAKGMNNISIRFYNVLPVVTDRDIKGSGHIAAESYYRFVILEMFEGYKKVIYIDSDLIIKRDLGDLYDIDIKNNCVAGVRDADFIGQCNHKDDRIRKYCKKQLGIEDYCSYMQAGVLVINIEELKKVTSMEQLMKYAESGKYKYMDQDILNAVCKDRIKYLDMKWNVLTDCAHYRINHVIRFAPKAIYDEYREARKNPYIIHYAGYLKPWHNPGEDFANEFWMVARQTPYYERLLFDMNLGAAGCYLGNGGKPRIKDRLYNVYTKMNPETTARRKLFQKIYHLIK